MKRLLFSLAALLLATVALLAQNDKADNIVGTYISAPGAGQYRVRITRSSDGTYTGQVCWVKEKYKDGQLQLDDKNPDKSLRQTPCDQIVLFRGLKYDAKKKHWGETKIYDPNRGIKANMTATFVDAKTLHVRGTLLGFGETEVWTKEK